MKSRFLMCFTAITLFAAPTIPVRLAAQNNQDHKPKQHRYKLVIIDTFGGPTSGVNGEIPPRMLSNQGVLAGCADTSTPDPNYPNFNPFNANVPGGPLPDPLIFQTFQWKKGILTDLGAFPGTNSSCAFWVSGNGLIVGASGNGSIDPLTGWPEINTAVWQDGQISNLGTLPGGNESFAIGANNHGQVVGTSANSIPDSLSFFGFGTQTRAVLWQNGAMEDLGTLGTGPDAFAVSVNDRGQVLGFSYINSIINPTTGIPTGDAFFWDHGTMQDIPDPLGGTIVTPFYLNNRGQAVGYVNLLGDIGEQGHPFFWEKGVFTDVGTFGGNVGKAVRVNEAGQVLGSATYPGDQIFRAFLWQNGIKSDLGAVGNDGCSQGNDINSQGQVVGFSFACDGSTAARASLWEKGGPMIDLNTLIPANSGIYLDEATNISDRGEIAGDGFLLSNSDNRAVLLIPCDDGHTETEDCEGNAESEAALTASSLPSTLNLTTMTQGSPSPTDRMAAIRARLAHRYPYRSLGYQPK
jgi:probable HAF family extracellular repeat protein